MSQGGLIRQLIAVCDVLIGRLRAHLGHVMVLASALMGAITGSSVAALYALLITLASRALGLRDLEKIFLSAALSAAAILVIIGLTSIFNRAMVLEQVPQSIAAWAVTVTDSALVFLLVVNVILLVVGMFMETNAATLLMGPLLAPTAAKFGIDPIHFAIILVTNIELGLLTPPLAANLYVAARTNRVPIIELLRNLGWFLLASLVVMVLITYVRSWRFGIGCSDQPAPHPYTDWARDRWSSASKARATVRLRTASGGPTLATACGRDKPKRTTSWPP